MGTIILDGRKLVADLYQHLRFIADTVAYVPGIDGSRPAYLFVPNGPFVTNVHVPLGFRLLASKNYCPPDRTYTFRFPDASILMMPEPLFENNYAKDPDFKRLCTFLWTKGDIEIGNRSVAKHAGIELLLP
jgi:hypothetical protein